MNPLISVIIPVFNVVRFCPKCIHSILSQTFQDFELLLIDDGSTDGSEKLCDRLASENERIQVFHIKNSGPSNARNVGLKHAKGKYIYCMDSDDYLEKNAFAKVVEEMEKGYDMVSFNFIREDEEGNILRHSSFKKQKMTLTNREMLLQFLCSSFLCYEVGWEGWNRFYRKDIIDQFHIRYCIDSRIGEDMAFCLCYMLHISSYQVLPDEYYHYIKRDGTLLSKSKQTNNFPVFEKMAFWVLEHIDQYCDKDFLKYYPTILMSFLAMELSRLHGLGITECEGGKLAYQSLSKKTLNMLRRFVKEATGKSLLGLGLFLKYRYDAMMCINNGSNIHCILAKAQYNLYYKMRALYHRIR